MQPLLSAVGLRHCSTTSIGLAFWLLLACGLANRVCADAGPPRQLWLYYGTNLEKHEALARLDSVWRRAAAAGYTHVMLADGKFSRLGAMDARYFANVKRVKRLAEQLKLEVVPAVFPVGRSGPLLWHDPHLAEALPVKDALFVVRNGEARLMPDPPVSLGTRPEGMDSGVRLEGPIARIRDNPSRARFLFKLKVAPYRCYHVSVRIRTRGFTGQPLVRVVSGWDPLSRRLFGSRRLAFVRSLGVRPTQDWTTHHVVFNSLDHHKVAVNFGVWGPARGEVRWTDWRIEEIGPLNVVRRPGAPCVVEGYVEGRDYEPIRDPRLGVAPWRSQYEVWHEPPAIKTSLPDGTRLRVSWYHAAIVYNGQVTCCPSEQATMELLRDEARSVRALWGAGGYMMMHDEIRALNWDESCRRRGKTAGEILAAHVRDCARLLAGSTVYVWNDMFDPYHNAIKDYALVRGDLAGSWEGLDPSVVIVNWNGPRRDESLKFFAARGHRQIIAGYYDRKPAEIRGWLASARKVRGVIGVMYTTWQGNYEDLETFARLCREWEGSLPVEAP